MDAHRHEYGVEPIGRVLQIAPSSYSAAQRAEVDPDRRSARRQRDDALAAKIATAHQANYAAYGVRKV